MIQTQRIEPALLAYESTAKKKIALALKMKIMNYNETYPSTQRSKIRIEIAVRAGNDGRNNPYNSWQNKDWMTDSKQC